MSEANRNLIDVIRDHARPLSGGPSADLSSLVDSSTAADTSADRVVPSDDALADQASAVTPRAASTAQAPVMRPVAAAELRQAAARPGALAAVGTRNGGQNGNGGRSNRPAAYPWESR